MKNLVLLIPGNPSIPGIYRAFGDQLLNDLELPGEKIWRVLPHLGQAQADGIRYSKLSLHHIIEDHKQNVLALINQFSPQNTILLGHSLGSAITISLYQELKHVVDKFCFICPFLGPSDNNIALLKRFKHPLGYLGFKHFSRGILMHHKISRLFFRRMVGDHAPIDQITRELKKTHYLHHFYSLLSSYIDVFSELDIKERLNEVDPSHSYFIFAPDDYWVPESTVNLIPKNSKYDFCNISHDFCLNHKDVKIVANNLSHFISDN